MNVNTNNTNNIRKLQSSLYQLAKKDIQRISNLYEKVYQLFILKEAWRQVKANIKLGQIDSTVLQKAEAYGIEKLLEELRTDLQYEAYRIMPLRHEANDTDIIVIKNIIAQMAARILIYPIFKADFITNSFVIRQKADAALNNIIKCFDSKEYYVIRAHIQTFFDSINQDKLMNLIEQRISDSEMLYLIGKWVSSGIIYQKSKGCSSYGINKDLVISPLLMSIYLGAFDKAWNNHPITYGKLVRYADEITILCDNMGNANQALVLLQILLASLDLKLDYIKTEVVCDRYIKESYDLLPIKRNELTEEPVIYSEGKIKESSRERDEIIHTDEVLQSDKVFPSNEALQSDGVLQSEEVLTKDEITETTASSFCGYKYRFGLYAAHSNVENIEANLHYHTFTIILYIHAGSRIDDNYSIEKIIQEWLAPLQGTQLSKTDLFTGKATTIEGIGDILFASLYDVVHRLGYELIKLSIYENPIRVYSASYKRLDSTVNEINDISLDCIPILNLEDYQEATENVAIEAEAAEKAAIEEKKIAGESDVGMVIKDTPLQGAEEEVLKEVALALEEAAVSSDAALDLTILKPNVFLLFFKCILGFGCFAALAMVTMYIVKQSGRYLEGYDIFCHLYRADLLYKNIQQGNWFPLYDGTWYNGVEIMRYWGPLPLYIMACLKWLIHGTILDTYVLLLGILLSVGGFGWLLWGITYRRIGLSVIIGLLWFYMPENMRSVILEGNLPRGVINALLPFFFYFLWQVMAEKKRKAYLPLILVTVLITLCHLGITLMLIATTVIFITFHTAMNNSIRSSSSALIACISGVLLAGLWVVPALIGGAASGSATNQVMKTFFESALVSLNPFTRISGDIQSFYFGLSVFFICILGILLGPKNSKAGFITAVVLLICTTKSVYELFVKLPFSQFLWMIRFVPIGLAAAMVSFLLWKDLRKWAVAILLLILAADCATSYQYIYFPEEYRIEDAQAKFDKRGEETLITRAKEITDQRMALLDLSKYGSFAPYYITGVGKTVNYTFGAGWEGAGTASNIVNLNAAVEDGWYVYLFDRALELGNDTVLIPIDNLKEKSKDIDRLTEAAKISGYDLVENDGTSILFHKTTPAQFGVVTEYNDIAIGESASGIAMIFPCFEEGTKNNINEYTFEELCNYRTIYLSGFTYNDKASAEALLTKLAESGVNIYIDMNRIPINEVKKSMELFGITSQNISFTDTFPEFTYQGTPYLSLDFSYDIGVWNTVYLIGLDQVDGSCDMTNKILPFIGTARNSNLHFVGLNIVYYLQTTRDAEINKLAEAIFGMKEGIVPNREVVPINIQKSKNQITITSEFDHVNTTLSYIDIFHSNQKLSTKHNLVMVNSGTTVIHMSYPHIEKGLAVTVIGFILSIASYIIMRRMKGYDNHEEAN